MRQSQKVSTRNVSLGGVCALVLLACAVVPPSPIEPVSLIAPGTPTTAIQRAASFAVEHGFDVLVSDAAAGVFRGQRRFEGLGTHEFFTCKWGEREARNLRLNVLVSFNVSAAARSGDSVTVRISSLLAASTPALRGTDLSTDCRTTGGLETALSSAISGVPRGT